MAASYMTARRMLCAKSSPLTRATFRQAAPTRTSLRPRASQRHSSTLSESSAPSGSSAKPIFYATTLAVGAGVAFLYTTDTRAFFHQYLIPPVLRLVFPDAEDAHNAGVSVMKNLYEFGLHPRDRTDSAGSPSLPVSVFDTGLINPIGISAGLDKHADIPDALFALGASVVEVGGCTPLAQDGNPRPRMFRIPGLDGLINRYGLNSRGADDMAMRLRNRVRRFAHSAGLTEDDVLSGDAGVPAGSLSPGRLLLVQMAKNKNTDERDVAAIQRDYVYCAQRLARYADVLVINVSSPNTPGLRDLQAVEPLTRILSAVVEVAQQVDGRGNRKPRVMVKVSPDEDETTQMEGIVQAVYSSGVDGVIVGNTTKRRTGLVPDGRLLTTQELQTMNEVGGYSGPAMFNRTADLVGRYRKMLDARGLQLRGTGTTGVDALEAAAKETAIAMDEEAVDTSIAAIEGVVGNSSPIASNKPEAKARKEQWSPIPQEATASAQDKLPEQKVIFATGGISNGQQALEVLNAGASVAMVYTGLVYGGAGTVTRIKGEMKELVKDGGKEEK